MIKIKATNREMLDLLHGLYAVQELKGVRFAVAVSKNIDRLKSDLQYIDEASKPTEEFQELIMKVNSLGNPEENQDKLVKLEEENKDLIDKRKAQLEEVNVLLDDEVELELTNISEDILPTDITAKQLGSIIKLVNN